MEDEILKKLGENERKLEEIYKSVEKTRKYFLWILIISIVVFALPLIGLIFILPMFLNSYLGSFGL